MLEHGNSDAVFVISGGSHEEAMEELVDDPLHGGADPQVVSLGETEPASSSHCFFTNIGVFIIKEVQDRILNEVDGAHGERLEIEHLECSQRQGNHLGALGDALVVGLLRFVELIWAGLVECLGDLDVVLETQRVHHFEETFNVFSQLAELLLDYLILLGMLLFC